MRPLWINLGRAKMKHYLVTILLIAGCSNTENQSNVTNEVYYAISSEQDEDGSEYFLISTDPIVLQDSVDGIWSVSMNKVIQIKSGVETVNHFLEARNGDSRDLRPSGPIYYKNEFYIYGFKDGVKTIMKNQMKPEYQVIGSNNNYYYLSSYGVNLNESELEAFGKVKNLFLRLETQKRDEEGLPINLEVEVQTSALDTLQLMLMDNWKSQLKRVQEQSK
nr:hypothetical protein [Algoriphagus sp.]